VQYKEYEVTFPIASDRSAVDCENGEQGQVQYVACSYPIGPVVYVINRRTVGKCAQGTELSAADVYAAGLKAEVEAKKAGKSLEEQEGARNAAEEEIENKANAARNAVIGTVCPHIYQNFLAFKQSSEEARFNEMENPRMTVSISSSKYDLLNDEFIRLKTGDGMDVFRVGKIASKIKTRYNWERIIEKAFQGIQYIGGNRGRCETELLAGKNGRVHLGGSPLIRAKYILQDGGLSYVEESSHGRRYVCNFVTNSGQYVSIWRYMMSTEIFAKVSKPHHDSDNIEIECYDGVAIYDHLIHSIDEVLFGPGRYSTASGSDSHTIDFSPIGESMEIYNPTGGIRVRDRQCTMTMYLESKVSTEYPWQKMAQRLKTKACSETSSKSPILDESKLPFKLVSVPSFICDEFESFTKSLKCKFLIPDTMDVIVAERQWPMTHRKGTDEYLWCSGGDESKHDERKIQECLNMGSLFIQAATP
jgi:hypothetical protein